jgi:uncharacterized phage protein (TIGR02218 family)
MNFEELEREGGSPVECYHFVRGSDHWRWTSAESAIEVDGDTYVPAAITRGRFQINEEAKTATVDVLVPADNPVAQLFSRPSYYVPVQLTILRVQLEDDEYSAPAVIFNGEAKTCTFTPKRGQIHCVPMQEVVNRSLTVLAYQPTCNNALYDSRCQVSREEFTWEMEVEEIIPANPAAGLGPQYVLGYDAETVFSGDAIGILANGIATFGYQRQMIIAHSGATIQTLGAFDSIEVGDLVSVSAGCSKTPEVCRDRFDNLERFLGFPHIPQRNPFEGSGGLV